MVETPRKLSPAHLVEYPESDGLPMSESDITRHYLIYCVEAMRIFFQSRSQVYVSGNMFIYYQEGDPSKNLSPDVFVVYGVPNYERRTYKIWEEGKTPAFVLEITSKTTRRKDEVEKPLLYARLGVQEYFQYDPSADYLDPPLQGYRLVDGNYLPLPATPLADRVLSIHSEILGLALHLEQGELRFYNPKTGEKLLSHAESEAARQTAEAARQTAEVARQMAEAAQQTAEDRAERLAARLRDLGIDPDAL